jgi:pimeloyl-ACP methyl ester carboxylesterase
VLLLHGFPDRADLWRPQIDALKSDFTVIAPDLRGFGDSDKPDDVRIGKSVGDMIAILDELGIEQTHVVGHDWGAGVAWAFAFSAAERLDRLAVLSVGHPGVPHTLAQREKGWYRDFFLHPEAEEILRRDDWKLLREWASTHPEPDRVLADLERPGALTAGLNWYRCNHRPRNELQPPRIRVTAPTLGIWSSGDAYLLEAQMTGSAEFVDDWRYERVEGAGHWMQLDAPERVTTLLREHLLA